MVFLIEAEPKPFVPGVLSKIAEEIGQIKGVKDVKIISLTIEGFIADNISHILRMMDERCIIIWKQGYGGLITDIRKRFGTGGEAFLYYVGFESCVEYGKSHIAIGLKLGIVDSIKIFRAISAGLFNSVDFGRMEVKKISANPPEATIRIYDSFECELGVGTGKTYSHLTHGMHAGGLNSALQQENEG